MCMCVSCVCLCVCLYGALSVVFVSKAIPLFCDGCFGTRESTVVFQVVYTILFCGMVIDSSLLLLNITMCYGPFGNFQVESHRY